MAKHDKTIIILDKYKLRVKQLKTHITLLLVANQDNSVEIVYYQGVLKSTEDKIEELEKQLKENKMKNDLEEAYNQAVYDLTEFIVHRTKNSKFVVSEATTNNFKEFKEETIKNQGVINISLEGSDNTIYGNKYVNTLARVWHDEIHITHNLSFNEFDEAVVAKVQKEEVYQYFKNKGVYFRGFLASHLIYLDIMEQVKYYKENKEYVVNQNDFIKKAFVNSLSVKEGWMQ